MRVPRHGWTVCFDWFEFLAEHDPDTINEKLNYAYAALDILPLYEPRDFRGDASVYPDFTDRIVKANGEWIGGTDDNPDHFLFGLTDLPMEHPKWYIKSDLLRLGASLAHVNVRNGGKFSQKIYADYCNCYSAHVTYWAGNALRLRYKKDNPADPPASLNPA